MLKEAKGFVIGVFCTSLVFGATAVFADPVQKQISAVYNNIKLVVNGQNIISKDSDGKVVDPFISEGTTYLPVRAVAEALGQPVEWDQKTNTVYLGKKPEGMGTSLTSLPYARVSGRPLAIDGWSGGAPFTIASKKYAKGFSFQSDNWATKSDIVYNTNSLYKKLTGVFGIDDAGKDKGNSTAILTILGDGKEIFKSKSITPGDTMNVDVDITNVNQVTFHFDFGAYINPVFADPQVN